MTGGASDTIFAVASGAGRAAVAVLRISGPASGAMVAGLCATCPAPRRAVVRSLRGTDGEVLDQALVLWMPGPRSYTGEDAAELHVHGGRAVLDGVSDALARLGARPAEPGEFTRRAFLNGRLDLTEAEAVADLVAAETEAQRRQALRQLDGGLSAVLDGWAARLRRLLARCEASIDFPEETEADGTQWHEGVMGGSAEIAALRGEIGLYLADDHRGERLRDGLVFAVIGGVNVGKSSLVNALAGRDAAIVSPAPGTTRDAIEVRVVLAGVPVTLVDTAGLRKTADPVEAEGVRRARMRAETADLVIEVIEAGASRAMGQTGMIVANKTDRGAVARDGEIGLSLLTGEGFAAVRAHLEQEARRLTDQGGPPSITRARHRAALQDVVARLDEALLAPISELRAEDLRLSLRCLGRLTGQVDAESILGDVFAEFCIGK